MSSEKTPMSAAGDRRNGIDEAKDLVMRVHQEYGDQVLLTDAGVPVGMLVDELIPLLRELDIELDGVALPGSAAAIVNRLRTLTDEDRFV